MAPTEILADQHLTTLRGFLEPFGFRVEKLTGAMTAKEKREVKAGLLSGAIQLVVGTHALITADVEFADLALVITDEQHRFGVNQRMMLANKGDHADLLMMSATPIPRTLALSIYGDLDISTLTSFPSKKRDVKTSIVSSVDKKIFEEVDKSLEDGHQVYVVAPLIDYREDERYSVEKLFARYALRYKSKVGLLHGNMKQEEKERVLEGFYSGITPILVSTPVIEVGIDVKKANLMIIYDASNFGLASLHQLRGRIGRDGSKARCLLTLDDETDTEALDRLNVLVKNEDGFVIAEKDMELRGPGELAGFKQSGIPNFSFLNIVNDFKIFVVARDDAKEIMSNRDLKENSFYIERLKKEIEFKPITKY